MNRADRKRLVEMRQRISERRETRNAEAFADALHPEGQGGPAQFNQIREHPSMKTVTYAYEYKGTKIMPSPVVGDACFGISARRPPHYSTKT